MTMMPRSNRMTTGMERVFKVMPDGLYRELYLHFIHFKDENGNIISSKLDKTIKGKLYKDATKTNERSLYGEVEYTFPSGETKRLIALGHDYNDQRYGRF